MQYVIWGAHISSAILSRLSLLAYRKGWQCRKGKLCQAFASGTRIWERDFIPLSTSCRQTSRCWAWCAIGLYLHPWHRQRWYWVTRAIPITLCRNGIVDKSMRSAQLCKKNTIDLPLVGVWTFYFSWSVEKSEELILHYSKTKHPGSEECWFWARVHRVGNSVRNIWTVLQKNTKGEILSTRKLLNSNEDFMFHCIESSYGNGQGASCHAVSSKLFRQFETVTVQQVICFGKLMIYKSDKASTRQWIVVGFIQMYFGNHCEHF